MDTDDPKKYCSIQPNFPKSAYLCYIFYASNSNLLLVPYHKIFTKLDEVREYILETVEFTKEKDASVEISPESIIIPLKLESLVPLMRKYWEGAHEEFTYDDRTHLFLEFLRKPQHYKMVVTPSDYDDKSKIFSFKAALPIKGTSGLSTVENFMQHSDYPVNEMASHAAIYTPKLPKRYNWLTKKIDYPQEEKNTTVKTSN